MGRYDGTLHKLIDSASSSNSKTKWNQVLHYLEGHTIANNDVANPAFESPLPPYSSPSVELEVELFDQQGAKREDSPLKIAVKCAPAVVIAALCHLGPESTKLADSRDRLPIHWACRRNADDSETEKVICILAKAAPETLLHRDDGGRTPLHWLFWYHAPSRSPDLVKFLCQELPVQNFKDIRQPRDVLDQYPLPEIPIPSKNKGGIPPIAAIIPDNRHGALPLHYAVMQGASKEAMKILINEHPSSIDYGDRKGRTALAWYLGAGHLLDNNKRHICGEANDPNATPWWYVKLSPALIQLLVSSKVARIVDDMGRTPLHWACHFCARSMVALNSSSLPLRSFQILLDNNIQAVITQDVEGQTPLHVLFNVVAEQQDLDHQRLIANRTLRENIDLVKGGPIAFNPEKQLIEMLLKHTDVDGQEHGRFDVTREEKKLSSASYIEDVNGLLPLHTALRVATEPEIIQLLIQSNPTSLIHASEDELQTPLIHAFCSEYTAPLQNIQTFELLMAAYVTSRHGTFIDGRVALKMEDASGTYPMHYACQYQACSNIITMFIEKFPNCAVHQNSEGDLPLHCLLSADCLFDRPHNGVLKGATLAQTFAGLQTDKEIAWQQMLKQEYREKMKCLITPLRTAEHLKVQSSAHGMTPLHIAVGFRAVPYATIYRLIDTYPEASTLLTTVKGYEFSSMDLHEMNREETEDTDEWDAIRELLFAFNPMLEEYRRKDELLEACVRLIRNEIAGEGSYHLDQLKGQNIFKFPSIELKETLSSIEMPEIDVAYRPKARKNKPETPKESKATAKKSPSLNVMSAFSFGGEKKIKKVEKSIYDDDLDDGYVVSPVNSDDEGDDDDDDDFLSSDDEDEEYFSDEESESETDEDTSFDQSTNRSSWGDRHLSSGPSGTFTDSAASPKSAISPRSGTSSPSKATSRKSRRSHASPSHVEEKKEEIPENSFEEGIVLSDIAMRLWCFFVLYNETKSPEDNYLKQVEAITDELEFDVLEQLMSLPVPEYAEAFLEEGTSTAGVTLRDVASPTTKALFRSFQYFLGKYEFPTELDGILLHRNSDGNTLYVRAIEHVIRTKEYLPKQKFAPGEAEETIWATGENVEEEGGYIASKFIDKKRSVCFKLTRNQEAYDNEVQCRNHLGLSSGDQFLSNVIPLFDNFAASEDDRKGKKLMMDVNDDRFQTVKMFGGESINLSEYPYVLVYPYSEEGDLFDYFFHHGLDGMEDVTNIGTQIASALKSMHEKGVVHGNISMRHVKMVPLDDESAQRTWAVSDFSTATRSQAETAFMGTISHNGSAQFATGLLPPEMFVKLTAAETRIYQTYWEMVERVYKVNVDKRVAEPFVNLQTGATYVLRCHYVPETNDSLGISLPDLPYQLVPARESTDVWCFGLILFTLCSGGRPLFPSNLKTMHLLDYESIVGWDHEMASAKIYEHVEDPVAQDMLLHLLAPYDNRVELNMETILMHPFFNKEADKSAPLGKMINQRQNESAAYGRRRQKVVSEKSEDNWLDSRTTNVNCWNFDMLRKFNFSSTEIVAKLLDQKSGALSMPCNFVLLPYKLSSKNKKAKLAPTTKKDVERAERMGVLLLSLAKASFFACRIKDVIEREGGNQWTASKLLENLSLPSKDFESVKEDFMKVAATHVEAFRSNPISAVHKLIERRITEIRKFFKDSGKAFLYLVDEYAGIPLVGAVYAPYPMEVSESIIDKFLVRALPFMQISVMYARGVSGGVSGVVRLIFEAAYPHVPPSWASAAAGLPHVLDEDAFVEETIMLREALALLYSTKTHFLEDDLRFVRDSCMKIDARGTFGDMQRVVSAGCSMWTTKQGAAEIKEACGLYGFKEALDIQVTLEDKLRAQEQQIKKLQEEMERLAFRKELNLDVPEASISTRRVSNVSIPKIVTTPNTAPYISFEDDLATQTPDPAPTPIASNTQKEEEAEDTAKESKPANVASPTESSYDEFFDSKDAPSFDESHKIAETGIDGSSTKDGDEGNNGDEGDDESTFKSDAESLRDQMSLD